MRVWNVIWKTGLCHYKSFYFIISQSALFFLSITLSYKLRMLSITSTFHLKTLSHPPHVLFNKLVQCIKYLNIKIPQLFFLHLELGTRSILTTYCLMVWWLKCYTGVIPQTTPSCCCAMAGVTSKSCSIHLKLLEGGDFFACV